MGKLIDLTGQRFGRLTAKSPEGRSSDGKILWACVCECGATATVRSSLLRSGHTKSCGCMQKEKAAEFNRATKTTHHAKNTRLYGEWRGMRRRCSASTGEKYENYGKRGITVCAEWANSFEAFRDWALANGYRDDLTLDREDNDGPYCPENCRWVTMEVQNNNRRINHFITYQNQTRTLAQWAKLAGLHPDTLRGRLERGWDTERALTTKARRIKCHG